MDLEKLKYPIGEFQNPETFSQNSLDRWKADIRHFPQKLHDLTSELLPKQLDWIYRPGGWTIREVVHHCGDSHMNALIRFKLCLTEDQAEIQPYQEAKWVKVADCREQDITNSLNLIHVIHHRWDLILDEMTRENLNRQMYHPQYKRYYAMYEYVSNYAWHGRHHLAHIRQALHHKGQF